MWNFNIEIELHKSSISKFMFSLFYTKLVYIFFLSFYKRYSLLRYWCNNSAKMLKIFILITRYNNLFNDTNCWTDLSDNLFKS